MQDKLWMPLPKQRRVQRRRPKRSHSAVLQVWLKSLPRLLMRSNRKFVSYLNSFTVIPWIFPGGSELPYVSSPCKLRYSVEERAHIGDQFGFGTSRQEQSAGDLADLQDPHWRVLGWVSWIIRLLLQLLRLNWQQLKIHELWIYFKRFRSLPLNWCLRIKSLDSVANSNDMKEEVEEEVGCEFHSTGWITTIKKTLHEFTTGWAAIRRWRSFGWWKRKPVLSSPSSGSSQHHRPEIADMLDGVFFWDLAGLIDALKVYYPNISQPTPNQMRINGEYNTILCHFCAYFLVGAQGDQSNVLKLLLRFGCDAIRTLPPRLVPQTNQNTSGIFTISICMGMVHRSIMPFQNHLFLVGLSGLVAGNWLVGLPIQSKFWWQAVAKQKPQFRYTALKIALALKGLRLSLVLVLDAPKKSWIIFTTCRSFCLHKWIREDWLYS